MRQHQMVSAHIALCLALHTYDTALQLPAVMLPLPIDRALRAKQALVFCSAQKVIVVAGQIAAYAQYFRLQIPSIQFHSRVLCSTCQMYLVPTTMAVDLLGLRNLRLQLQRKTTLVFVLVLRVVRAARTYELIGLAVRITKFIADV